MPWFYSGSDAHGDISDVVLWRDNASGLEPIASISLRSPSWVAPHPERRILYVTEESEPGAVLVLSHTPRGELVVRQRISSHGDLPCHLAVDRKQRRLIASNYGNGTVAAWNIADDGTLGDSSIWQLAGQGPNLDRQSGPHAHLAHRLGDDLLAVDLGADRIVRLLPNGESDTVLALPSGFGPRHFVMVDHERAGLVGELSGEVALVDLHDRSVLDIVPATRGKTAQPSGITVRGSEVMVANRIAGTMAAFTVDGDHLVPGDEVRLPGNSPRALTSDAERIYVCVQDLGVIAVYGVGGDALSLVAAPHVSDFGRLPWN